MSPGTSRRARRRGELRAGSATRRCGGCTFAEHPELTAPEARIIWHADLDPGAISVEAVAVDAGDPDGVDLDRLAPWLTIVAGPDGVEHAVLSDGWHHLRLDVVAGSFRGDERVLLHYRISGLRSAEPKLLSLRRFLDLYRHRRFGRSLFPDDRRVERWVSELRVHDALVAGASHSDIARVLFGEDRVRDDRARPSDSLRLRVRRLVGEARAMAEGGYRTLLRRARTPDANINVDDEEPPTPTDSA